ncbi:methyltransferase family protein, partial [Nocardia sp. NPDC004722]
MSRSLAVPACLDPVDLEQLRAAIEFVRTHDTGAVLSAMLPALTAAEAAAMASRCRFSHTAVLVFPGDLTVLTAALESLGLTADPDIPSMVVRGRLAARHGVAYQRLDVRIVRAPLAGGDGNPCTIEIFAVSADTDITALRHAERMAGHEKHLALDVESVDTVELAGLRTLLLQRGGMRSDGGGYNTHEDATILYFRTNAPDRPYRRLELHVAGQHSPLLATHVAASHDAPTRLLRLLTGAWTTQALAATATLGVADQLAAAPGRDLTELARITGTDPDSLHRLLRYLTDLDIVRPRGTGYELTETGALLPVSATHSLHPLARLYGGAFYQSFAHLDHAVRTGTAGFDHHFGRHHFEHFSATPESAELFDAAMAASATIFLPEVH